MALDEKDVIEKIGKEDFDDIKDSLILMLDDYNSKRIPSAENVNELLTEIAHAELIQKPRYIANCLEEILQKFKKQPLDKIENLRAFYKTKSPTVRGTINSISALQDSPDKVRVFGFLTKYLKTLNKKDLSLFIRFVTGGDLLPEAITVDFVDNQNPRMPRVQTCTGVLMLSTCLLYTSPSPRDATLSRMPSSA